MGTRHGRWAGGIGFALVLSLGPPAGSASASAPAAEPRTADNGAKVVAEKRVDSSTLDLTVSSPAVGTAERVRVLLPKGWSRSAARTWPVVYAYQGGNDDYLSWVK